MKLWIPNIRFGLTSLFFTAVVGGMLLGGTFEENSVKDGYHMLEINRFFMREGHSHGNFMGFFNLFVGLILANLSLSAKQKKIASYAAMAAIFLPIGLFVHGVTGQQTPIGMIGVLGAAIALGLMAYGAWITKVKA